MERAYAGFRERGDVPRAARAALWLAREYQAVRGNAAASNGWYARAEGLLRDAPPASEHGWLALTRAERAGDPAEMGRYAEEAHGIAEATGDRDLEAAALARRGYAELAAGGVASGTDRLDEAMAAATGGDVRSLDVVGDITCVAIAAFELSSDWQRIEQWGQVMESWIQNHDDVAVLGFCYACCSELFLASGQWDEAEGMLTRGTRGAPGGRTPFPMRPPGRQARGATSHPGPARGGRAAPHGVRGAAGGRARDRASAPGPRRRGACRRDDPSAPESDR